MAWAKGQSGNAAGRPKGSRNRFSELRDEFMLAYEEIGGREALVKWGKDNPDLFYKLVVKMLPKERLVDMRTHVMTLEECLLGLNRDTTVSGAGRSDYCCFWFSQWSIIKHCQNS